MVEKITFCIYIVHVNVLNIMTIEIVVILIMLIRLYIMSFGTMLATHTCTIIRNQGPVVQSVVSVTSSLRVISLTVLADLIYNILILFAEKM